MLIADTIKVPALAVPDPDAEPGTAGANAYGDPVRSLLNRVDFADLASIEFESAALTTTYDVVFEGRPLEQACRLRKAVLGQLRAMGARVEHRALLLDYDHPKRDDQKVRWADAGTTFEELLARCPVRPSLAYTTRHGARLAFQLSEPVEPERFERLVRRTIDQFAAAGVVVDPACKDWTRLFKCPRVTDEDGSRSWEQPWYRQEYDPDEWLVPPPDDEQDAEPAASEPPVSATRLDVDDGVAGDTLDHSEAVARVKRNTVGSEWWHCVWNSRPFATSERHNALTRLVGYFCRETRAAGGAVEDAYAVCREATKFVSQEGHDWRRECQEMVASFWARDAQAPEQAAAASPAPGAPTEAAPPPVARDLVMNGEGRPLVTVGNLRTCLQMLGYAVWLDTFANRTYVTGPGLDGPQRLDDWVENRIWIACEEQLKFSVAVEKFAAWLRDVAYNNRRHPLREYLDSLQWDGVPRVERWLSTYFGAEDKPYTRAVGRIFLVAAVRRVRKPGTTYQEMLLLEGEQGRGKSTAIKSLAVRPEWFSDNLVLGAGKREVLEDTLGKWIVEVAELQGLKGGAVQEMKAFLSRDTDEGRMSYDRNTTSRARQFVIVGTTNAEKDYLLDWTGNRRFWSVLTGEVRQADLERDRGQLWAEACAMEAAGEPTRLDPSLYPVAAVEQEDRRVEDPFEEPLADMLGQWAAARIRCADVLAALGYDVSKRSQREQQRLGAAMRRLGWKKDSLWIGGRMAKCFWRGEQSKQAELSVRRSGAAYKVVEVPKK